MSSLQQQKKGGGGGPTFMILYIMNQVYSVCVIQCTIQNFHQFRIRNFEFRNDNILIIKHTLNICFIFHLLLRMIILFYGEYIVHLYCQWERRVIHTKIVYTCVFYASISIWHCIFSVSFLFSVRSVFRSAF